MKFRQTIDVDVDIVLPCYFEHGGDLLKILAPNDAIKVTPIGEMGTGITKVGYDTTIGIYVTNGRKISKMLFDEAYDQVLNYLKTLPNE